MPYYYQKSIKAEYSSLMENIEVNLKLLSLTLMIESELLSINLIGPKPLHIWLDKSEGFIKIYYGTISLVLFGPEQYDAIYNIIRYLIGLKSSITYAFSHCYSKNKIGSLPIEKSFFGIMFQYPLNKFLKKITITNTMI